MIVNVYISHERRYILRQPVFLHPFHGAAESRSDTPSVGGSPFLGTLYMVHTSCEAIRRDWAAALSSADVLWCNRVALAIRRCRVGDFAVCGARERAARAAGAKREGHLRFPSLFELLPFPRQPRERALRLYFIGNSHKGTGIGFCFLRCRGVIAADCTGFA